MSGRGHWANHMREDMKKDNNSGTLHLTEEVLISMMGLTWFCYLWKWQCVCQHDGKILYAGWDPVGGGSLGCIYCTTSGKHKCDLSRI